MIRLTLRLRPTRVLCCECFEILEPQPADKDMDTVCASCAAAYREWFFEETEKLETHVVNPLVKGDC